MPLKLTVFPADRPGRELVLWEGGSYVLGRSPDADFVVPDARVSNRHLLIDGRGRSWQVTDQASKNGTRIEGRPLDSSALDRPVWLNVGGVPAFAELQSRQDTVSDEQSRKRRRAAAAAIVTRLKGNLAGRVLLRRCLDSLCELSGCERSFVWMFGDNGKLAPFMLRGVARPRPSLSVIEDVAASGRQCVVSDTAGAEAKFRTNSIEQGGIRALVVLPLETGGRCLGVLYADSLHPGKTFTELDLDLLTGLAAQTAVALGVSRLRGDLDLLAGSAPQGA